MLKKLISRLKSAFNGPVALIDEALWHRVTRHYIFMRGLSSEENRRLRLIASDFISRKTIIGAGGLEIDDIVRIQIAAQACILILDLGTTWYDGWSEVIVYPGQFVPAREVMDTAGVVHITRDPMAGEAWLGGPVVLSYEDVVLSGEPGQAVEGYNVVIHEFAHKLDMRNGNANGFPPLHGGMNAEVWRRVFMEAYLDFCKRVDAADRHDRRRGSRMGQSALDTLPIDPYASENPAEFFAVASEAFFEMPESVADSFPHVYEQLKAFYRQDPLRRMQ